MNVGDLIKELEKCPKDLVILIAIDDQNIETDNYFVHSVELSETGESGYEIGGEVRLNAYI